MGENDAMTSYILMLEVLTDRGEQIKKFVELHRVELVEGDDVDCTAKLVDSLFVAYPKLCLENVECEGDCNRSLALLLGVAIHALASSNFDRDRPPNTRPYNSSLN